jgi:hypothetical protein
MPTPKIYLYLFRRKEKGKYGGVKTSRHFGLEGGG